MLADNNLQIDIFQSVMAALNFSEDGQQKGVGDLTCSPDLTPALHGQLIFISVLIIFMSVTAFIGNSLILIALRKESSAYCMSMANEHWNMFYYASTLGFTATTIFCGVSVLTLTALSVDRFLAMLLGLRYRQVVTLKRTYVIVIAIWVACTVYSAIQFWNRLITLWCAGIITSLCLVISSFSYTKIFLTLRHNQSQVQGHVQQRSQTNELNIARYKKAVSAAIWLQLTLVACCLPCNIVLVLTLYSGLSSSLCYAWTYTGTLLYLNSSLNPILYCWKIEEVRQTVKDTIRQVLCLCFSS